MQTHGSYSFRDIQMGTHPNRLYCMVRGSVYQPTSQVPHKQSKALNHLHIIFSMYAKAKITSDD